MRLNLLHLDDAFLGQSRFRAEAAVLGAHDIDLQDLGPHVRLWGTSADLERVRARLVSLMNDLDGDEPLVSWMGSGDFHHVSALLISHLSEIRKVPLTVVQFDNHPDWVANRGGIHCGSWVRHMLDQGTAQRVISIGMTSADLSWPELKGAGLAHVAAGRLVAFPVAPAHSIVFGQYGSGPGHRQSGRRVMWTGTSPDVNLESTARILSVIETDAIYVTIDKDVLMADDADTNWDQGQMRLTGLLAWLRQLAAKHKIIGLDVIGDRSKTRFGGPLLSQFLKRSEVLIDQPWRGGRGQLGVEVNEQTNLAILAAVRGVLC